MKASFKKGFSFGLTSGVITTLGLIVGLHSATDSRAVVFGGILLIAVADALSDAMGIHMSEEATHLYPHKEVWEATFATFISKFLVAITFLIPILLLPLYTAIIVSILWGIFLTIIFNYYLAKQQNIKPLPIVVEHLSIVILVIVVTYYIGMFVATLK